MDVWVGKPLELCNGTGAHKSRRMSLLQKVLKFDDVLIRLDTIPAYVLPTDRQTDGQTDRQTELVKQYRAPHALRNVARHEKKILTFYTD